MLISGYKLSSRVEDTFFLVGVNRNFIYPSDIVKTALAVASMASGN